PETAAPSAAPAGGQRLGLGLGPYPQMPALGQGFAHLGRPKDAAVKAAASLLGPPPKTQKKPAVPALPEEVARDEPQDPFQQAADPMLAALSLQSTALTSLVAHLAGHSTDPLIDLQGGSISSSSSSTRGVARREKMQSDLALRQSNYWLAFLQQLSRRMNPSRPVPTSTDMAKDSDLSFLAYLERHGAYKQSKEIGTILWVLGYIVDAAIAQDFDGVREHLALFATALDQAALDQGWSTAFLVTLAEEPPLHGGAVLLAYLKDLDIMNSKKQESPSKKAGASASQETKEGDSPKKRPRFPKKAKGRRWPSSSVKAMRVSPPPRDIQSSPREEGRDQNSWRGQPDDHAGQPQPSKFNHEAKFDALQQHMSLPKWCACLTSAVLRTRTPFAAFLARTFHLPRTSQRPPVDASELEQFDAFSAYLLRQAKSRYHRGLHGDRLGLKGQHLAKGQPQKLFVAFRSILQGDHTGVDVATSAHLSLLKGVGLLDEKSRLQSCTPLFDQSNCEGLCIDDYFAMSLETLGTPLQASGAKLKIDRALEAYQQAGILGSPEKDVLADKAKIVGAVCNSSAEARTQGVVTLGAPIEKRIALSVISLQLCTLTHTTDVLHVCLTGGWASAFMFRRPLMGLLHRVYDLVQGSVVDPNRPKICRLPRSVANEFVLAAILMPLASSDLSADFNTLLYCSDASSRMGAFCSASIPRDLSSVIWKACKSKGAYTRLLSQVESDIKRIGGSESFEDELETAAQPVNVRRPLAYRFAFVELFAGSSKVTEQMSQLGWSVGPPIDLSFSPEYDLSAVHGQYTKSSAMYTEDLARNLALALHDAILAKRALDEDWDGAPSAGLESLLVNQLALEAPWQTEKKWTFKGASHINIQESVSVLRAIEHASRKGSPQRTSILVDSNVVRCAVSKGRTSSRGLMPILAKINAVSLAAGQYLCLPFCPTRLNPSDDPTRGVELRSPVREGATLRLSLSEWEDMASHKGLRSTAANWLRFVVLVGGTHLLSLRDQSSFRQPPVWEYRSFLNRAFPREFDSTLGFPGEGPLLLLLWIFVASPLSSSFLGGRGTPPFWISGAILGGTRCAMAVTIEPRNPGDQRRADYRKRIGPLPTGRPVLKVTEKRREVLLSAFTRWLEGRGVVVDDLFVNTYQTIEEINTLLTAYGRELHLAGRPLNDFSETINSISSWKPQLRRTLQGAWDLAYSW
ncbi:unnamed protein product, partial [Durusdinium trenchii]